VLTPTHPGFNATPRTDSVDTIRGLATVYTALLDALDLRDVTVVGNSIGGWIAAEMALLASSPDQQHDPRNPDAFRIDPTSLSPAAQTELAGNRAALALYAGQPSMVDPGLHDRLQGISVPTLVVWGDSDGIVDPGYGRAHAAAIPTAHFQLLTNTGHLPQIERPQQLLEAIWDFADAHAIHRPS
jgi:pimeloyl-ACP methyl ester carboxylesterase